MGCELCVLSGEKEENNMKLTIRKLERRIAPVLATVPTGSGAKSVAISPDG